MEFVYRYDPYQPIEAIAPADAEEALSTLVAGNQRFAEFVDSMLRTTLGEQVSEQVVAVSPMSLGLPLYSGGTLDQSPFAIVVGCSDARAPVEQLFDLSFNTLFVLRIAGNVLGTECLGSIDYAVRNLGRTLRVVMVLGHSGCGAVTAAVDTYLRPADFSDIASTHGLRSLVDRIMVSVRASAKAMNAVGGERITAHPRYREAFIELAVYLNAAVTAHDLNREFKALGDHHLRVVFSVFDLETMRIHAAPEFCDVGERTEQPPFADAPADADAFNTLALGLADHVIKLYKLA